LAFLLVQKLDLYNGTQVFLEKAAFPAGLLLRQIGCAPQLVLEIPPENEEKRHQRKKDARKSEIEHEHCSDDKNRIERCLENVWHKTRTQFGHLIYILFHTIELFPNGGRFVVIGRETIHLFQDVKPDAEHEFLHGSETHEPCKRGKAQATDVEHEEPRRGKEQQVQILLWKNPVNEPLNKERVEKKHQAAEYNQRNAEDMRTQKRAQLAKKPAELLVELRIQEYSWGPLNLPKLEIALNRYLHLNMTTPEQEGTPVKGCKSAYVKVTFASTF